MFTPNIWQVKLLFLDEAFIVVIIKRALFLKTNVLIHTVRADFPAKVSKHVLSKLTCCNCTKNIQISGKIESRNNVRLCVKMCDCVEMFL